MILNNLVRLQVTELKKLIETDADFWQYIESQEDFESMRITFLIFKPFMNLNRRISNQKVMEYLHKHSRRDLSTVLNTAKGQKWLMTQIEKIMEKLKKI